MPVLFLWHQLLAERYDAASAMLSMNTKMVLISEGIESFRNDSFALLLPVAVVETIETTMESLGHSDK